MLVVARKPRENLEGGVYHVYARGNAKGRVFLTDLDRRAYLRSLANVVSTKRWICLAYCLMDNHIHLLLETPNANLSAGMQRLQSEYAQAFNARHQRSGHVFQGRYGAVRITTDGQLALTAAYIARNPVEAGRCRRPGDWPWSSYAAVMGGWTPSWLDSGRLLRIFDPERGAARDRYAEMSTGLPAVSKGV